MRIIHLTLVAALTLSSCASTGPVPRRDATGEVWYAGEAATDVPAPSGGPCADPQYLQLQLVPIDAMTDRQYEYFMLKERQCQEWTQHHQTLAQSRKNRNGWIGALAAIFVGIPLLIAAAAAD